MELVGWIVNRLPLVATLNRGKDAGFEPGIEKFWPSLRDTLKCITIKTASVRELRNNFAKLSRWLKAGEEVEITNRGKPMARLVPTLEPKPRKKRIFDIVEHRKWMKKVYGGKVLKGNSVLIMREGSEW